MIELPQTQVTKLRHYKGCIVVEFNNMKRFNLAQMEGVKSELVPVFVNKDSKFIISFDGFDFMDSTGIGCLILLSKSSKRNNSQMKVCNIAPNIKSILDLLSIPMIIDIEDDIDSCVANFKDDTEQ